jgi:phenylacetyl-CoA:acceptor oxidoreductase
MLFSDRAGTFIACLSGRVRVSHRTGGNYVMERPARTVESGVQKLVPTYCYNCVSGPDLLSVKVIDGVARSIEPNFEADRIDPTCVRPCVKAYGLIQKTYNPNRVLTPMKRTNPRKGMDQDPGFVPISWDEALDTIAFRLRTIRAHGVLDEEGLPRVAASFGHGGTPSFYMGTFAAFLAAWGPVDFSFGSGQGVKCVHSEHLYGEYWHRAFTVSSDTPLCRYVVSFGANVEITAGAAGVARHAAARVRGLKRVEVEPHLSVTGACSAKWVPIKPKTDAAFMFAMLHVLVHEHARSRLDVAFLRDHTASPYLVGPNGFYLRDPASRAPLVWDTRSETAVPFDTPGIEPACEGSFTVASAIEAGPDNFTWHHRDIRAETGFSKMVSNLQPYSPEWAEKITDVPAATIREVANEYLDNACVGQTIEINGTTLPYRPVAVTLGKTVNNGWGGYECCWARTVLAALVGALEVPGGLVGTTVRLNRPHEDRLKSVTPGPDGFMYNALNPTDPEHWVPKPTGRNAHRPLVPIVLNTGWSQSLGPTHLAWMFQREGPKEWPQPSWPELWFVFRSNPTNSFWASRELADTMSRMPFAVCFAYTVDETNYMADILLPEATDLESLQLIRMGGTGFEEQFWTHQGFVLRQQAVEPQGEARDFTWITTELARRTGLLEKYIAMVNRGAGAAVALKGKDYDFSLKDDHAPTVEEIWDASCKAATAELSGGEDIKDLAWFKEHGFYSRPFPHTNWYLYPTMVAKGLRFELPYQEKILRSGLELANRLHESEIHWWDEQLKEYMALPEWHDLPSRWIQAVTHAGKNPDDFPFWLLTTKSMQYASGGNAGIQLMHEVSMNVRGHGGVVINRDTAIRLGIAENDLVEVRSPWASTQGRAIVTQGIRPDTVLIVGQFDHWATPYAKDLHVPSLNTIAPMSIELTDATGSGADLVRVAILRSDGPRPGA